MVFLIIEKDYNLHKRTVIRFFELLTGGGRSFGGVCLRVWMKKGVIVLFGNLEIELTYLE